MVLGPYKLVLLDIRWYEVSKGLVCLYMLEKVEIWSGDTDASQTTEDRATQLLYSIQFKLSHAMQTVQNMQNEQTILPNYFTFFRFQLPNFLLVQRPPSTRHLCLT